ncbi:hypothetical protein [Siphonobacter sp. SORGH_AS_0500]|uniref:hypothetical protein n=1 Tax=Siphonobacter sp. SORGH_AS_0500 TaxID=1864824 RepID=UPI0028660C4D|nr:hypothetical protein [Siphonobacter sp. SORGH_AS_0500]MDR6195671.1 hypothetical protein [Siphonobacter sp. SORGH_AS_0500]
MNYPEWIEVRQVIKLISTRGVELPVPEGFYLRLDQDRYYLTNGDGFDLQDVTFKLEAVENGLNDGSLFDCSSATFEAFKTQLKKTREAQKMYFSRRTAPLLSYAKASEARLDDLLSQVKHSHPKENLVTLATTMRDSQIQYFNTRSSHAKNIAIALEKAIDKLLMPDSSHKTDTSIQSSLFQ